MAFDRAAAKAAGYSDEEINAYLQANPEVAKETPPAPSAAEDVPPPPSTVVPEVDRTNEMLATGGLALSDVGAALPYAGAAYGAYKGAQLANVGLEAIKGYGQRTAVNEFNTLMNNYSKMNHDIRQYQKAGQAVPQSLLDAQTKLGQQIEAAQSRISTTPVNQPAPKGPVNPATAPGAQAAPKAIPQVAPQAPAPTGPVAPQAPAAAPTAQVAQAAEKPGMLKNLAQMAGKYGSAFAESPLGKTLGGAARIAGSAPAMGAQLALYSGGLNQGEDQQMARIRAIQDSIGRMPKEQQSFYFTLPPQKKQQVDQMIMSGQDPSALLTPNAINSGYAQQLRTLGR